VERGRKTYEKGGKAGKGRLRRMMKRNMLACAIDGGTAGDDVSDA
jgi:hypothetical protein